MKRMLLLSMLIIAAFTGMSQDVAKTVNGVVYLGKDEPVAGVLISVPGTEISTLSGPYGFYSIDIPTGKDLLIASAMRYKDFIIKVRNKHTRDIHLKLDKKFSLKESFRKEFTLTGKVYDETKEVAPGTSVWLNGTPITSIGETGKYSIKVYAGDIVRFTFIDRKTQTMIVQSGEEVKDIILKLLPPRSLQ